MKHISELAQILNNYFNWNKARITCLSEMVRGILAVKTVNLTQVASAFISGAKKFSSYRRMQRFFQLFSFDHSSIIRFILNRFPLSSKFMIVMDRTNWKFGKTPLNMLVVSIIYEEISIPLFWINLEKEGNSSAIERMYVIMKTIFSIGKSRIISVVADREFIGEEWVGWLCKNKIPFVIRVKENMLVERFENDKNPVSISSLFTRLKNTRKKYLKSIFFLKKNPVYLSASRSPFGELLVVITNQFNRKVLQRYKKRWCIETLFSCLKSRGFCLEETRLTGKKLEKLLFVVVIAFCWSYLVGIIENHKHPIPLKKHGRKSRSLFRLGYDILREALLKGMNSLRKYFKILEKNRLKGVRI